MKSFLIIERQKRVSLTALSVAKNILKYKGEFESKSKFSNLLGNNDQIEKMISFLNHKK